MTSPPGALFFGLRSVNITSVSEAIKLCAETLDCFVALLLAMTGADYFERTTSPYFGASLRKPRSIIQSTFS